MSLDKIGSLADQLIDAVKYEKYKEYERHNYWEYMTCELCEALRDLLGPFNEHDPATDGPIHLEVRGEHIRKAQAALAEVEKK